MANVDVISNADKPLKGVLKQVLASADEFRVASAFLNSGGLDVVLPDIARILENEGSVTVLHGADFRITDPRAVWNLVNLRERYANFLYLVHFDWDLTTSQRFHPKLYMSTADYRSYTAVVGSSNLTYSGLTRNEEVNVVLTGERGETPIRQCNAIYESFIRSPELIEPDLDFADRYDYFHAQARDLPILHEPPSAFKEFVRELSELYGGIVDPPTWTPKTQVEVAIQTLQLLEAGDSQLSLTGADRKTWPLSRIYAVAERLARKLDKDYDWHTFDNSIRGRINDNVVDLAKGTTVGKGYFERSATQAGYYRLSAVGRAYAGEKLDPATPRSA